jgi:hypothetical protein
MERCVSPDKTAWLLGAADFSPGSTEYRWNEFEEMALEFAESDLERQSVRTFWNHHFPFLLSVRSDYDYFAVRVSDGAIVLGSAPEWEEPSLIAESFDRFVEKLTSEPVDRFPWALLV